MFEVLLGVGIGLLLALNVALWLKLDRCYNDLHQIISDASKGLEVAPPVLDGIEDIINNTVGDIMSNLHVPTASDHFIGGLSQIMQMWAMKKFSPMIDEMQNQLEMPGIPTDGDDL